MTSDDARITLPTVGLRNSRFSIRIDTGELLFPAIVFLFCSVYYAETRGLPAESMLYAKPLLYATASLAVITMFGHAVSVDIGSNGRREQPSSDSTKSVIWGVESAVAKREHPRKIEAATDSDGDETDANAKETDTNSYFNVRSAIGLVVLSTGYVLSLYLIPFVFGTALFLAAAVYLFGERDLFRILGYSVGITLLLWLVFINWLRVPLP
jgi:hypothetical protein